MTHSVALVTDRAGSFATVPHRPVPRLIDGGRILVTTLATFHTLAEAKVFLRGLRGLDMQQRERTPQEIEALHRQILAFTASRWCIRPPRLTECIWRPRAR